MDGRHQTRPVLSDVCLALEGGQSIKVFGPCGSGKTTLLHFIVEAALGRMNPSMLGSIELRFRQIAPGRLGIVFDDAQWAFCNLRVDEELAFVLENAGVPQDAMRSRLRRTLSDVGLEGYGTRRIATLSGGELRKLAIGAVLIGDPEVMVSDDLHSSLDLEAIGEIESLLDRRVREGNVAWMDLARRPGRAGIPLAEFATLVHGTLTVHDAAPENRAEALDALDASVGLPPALALVRALFGTAPKHKLYSANNPTVHSIVTKLRRSGRRVRCTARTRDVLGSTILQADGISFAFPGGMPILRNCSIELCAGRVHVLAGRNGSGKSTLARILCGLVQAQTGRCLMDSHKVSLSALRRAGSLVFQNPEYQFVTDSVRTEVTLAFTEAQAGGDSSHLVQESLERLDLTPRSNDHPMVLSMGEKRRLAVMTALARRCQFLIVDEPTLGQDLSQTRLLGQQLRTAAAGGMAVLVITHDPDFIVEFADLVSFLGDGRIEDLGEPSAAFSTRTRTTFSGQSPLIEFWEAARAEGIADGFFPRSPSDLLVVDQE